MPSANNSTKCNKVSPLEPWLYAKERQFKLHSLHSKSSHYGHPHSFQEVPNIPINAPQFYLPLPVVSPCIPPPTRYFPFCLYPVSTSPQSTYKIFLIYSSIYFLKILNFSLYNLLLARLGFFPWYFTLFETTVIAMIFSVHLSFEGYWLFLANLYSATLMKVFVRCRSSLEEFLGHLYILSYRLQINFYKFLSNLYPLILILKIKLQVLY